jgi:hypothetical protein
MLLMAAIFLFPATDIEFDSLFILLCLRQYQRLCCSTKWYAYYSNIALCIINSVCSLNIKNSTFQLTDTIVMKTLYSTIQSRQLLLVATKSFLYPTLLGICFFLCIAMFVSHLLGLTSSSHQDKRTYVGTYHHMIIIIIIDLLLNLIIYSIR